ncbi:hypothetical protein GCM10029963_04420 [Micromonospora andamanensis]|uniref:hypothetical protein n=1 Tax=Micromonospora andamanensis TaxID=1287068 RepID=UPI001951DA7D|nr:hypothetical protein [Micromonospora andamanensis]GIJ39954.1 hypothetical protein Vwe01_32790 [Micromonospora andamanensis]
MEILSRLTRAALVGAALTVLVACGSDAGSGASTPGETPGAARNADDAADSLTEPKGDECERLTTDEVADVIGAHDGGQHDYQLGGCVWTATSGGQAIHATVLSKDEYEAVAEIGEPVTGSADGAVYDDIHGELWFPCRGGDFCGIKADIGESDLRKDVALRMGTILQGRV